MSAARPRASARSLHSTYRSSSSRSAAVGSAPGAHSSRPSGRRSRSPARARWNAELTDASVVSSSRRGLLRRAAEDVAQHEHRPRQRREVLDRGDERELDGLLGERRALGALAPVGQLLEQLVGDGCSQATSPLAVGWRGRLSSASRHAFVAIRYSHARIDARPS